MDVRKMRNAALGKRVVAALESRNMEAYYVETKEEALKKALELIPKGSNINMGGAASIKECGLYDAISMVITSFMTEIRSGHLRKKKQLH